MTGVFSAKKKDGSEYFRAALTHKGRRISLGSYDSADAAYEAYLSGKALLNGNTSVDECTSLPLPFDKCVSLINLRDNGVYFKTPIYLRKKTFLYYLAPDLVLTFDAEDLFYYANHRIQRRGGRLFVADYGMQVTLGSRYGIKPFGVKGRDYEFLNGDETDYRYENLRILSSYAGVVPLRTKALTLSYKVLIHVKGNYTVGIFGDEVTAAIAYNKAADHLKQKGAVTNYAQNYIPELPAREYASIYTSIDIEAFKAHYDRRHPG